MNIQTSVFQGCKPSLWSGRYAKIPGDNTVFHLKYMNGRMWPVVFWETEDGTGTCAACECDAAAQLADAVEAAKRKAGGAGGGSFVINEYGQVLVPASDGSGRRFLAGEFSGRLLFENPFDADDPIDLSDCSNLHPGDPWKLPYVGIPHTLNASGQICFRQECDAGRGSVFPRYQDTEIVRTLISVRGNGGGRFIVNYAGIVLTKSNRGGYWHQVYVGSINEKMWFEKETSRA